MHIIFVVYNITYKIQCNPRRLQQFLDSTGGRDLFLSWLISAMAALSEMEHTTTNNNSTSATAAGGSVGGSQQQEVQLTKLIEYTVLLINQVYLFYRNI